MLGVTASGLFEVKEIFLSRSSIGMLSDLSAVVHIGDFSNHISTVQPSNTMGCTTGLVPFRRHRTPRSVFSNIECHNDLGCLHC